MTILGRKKPSNNTLKGKVKQKDMIITILACLDY